MFQARGILNIVSFVCHSSWRYLKAICSPAHQAASAPLRFGYCVDIRVCHFPPGTSKWNKIEHRMFSFITMNWRAHPLVSNEVIVNLIASPKTRSGLSVHAELDTNSYPKGIVVSDADLATIRIEANAFHGDWNYRIRSG